MENVKFLGYLQKDEMSEKFYQAKAVIMTSQCYEAFAMTIAEAYSYGCLLYTSGISGRRLRRASS